MINHIGLSGGKDSTALWGWAINESGYDPATIRGSFCDTGNEYQEVYDQVAACDAYGQARGIAPIRTLRNSGRWTFNQHPLFLALAIWKGRFPSATARFCTEHLKIIPLKKYIEELQLDGHEILAHSGVRASESIERSMMQEWDDGQFSCRLRRPLLKWSISDVWAAHKRYGLPINRLYFAGRKRVGCRLCVMSNKQDVRLTLKYKPWVIDLYRSWEKMLGKEFASFFGPNTVPDAMCSRTYKRKKDGKEFSIATIDDVARWSNTLRGGQQGGFGFMFEEEDFNLDDAHHACQSGYCE